MVLHFAFVKTKICCKCKRRRRCRFFSRNSCKKDGLQNECKPCRQKHCRTYYAKNKKRMVAQIMAASKRRKEVNRSLIMEYLSAHPCVDCREKDVVVLDFDHVRGCKRTEVMQLVVRGCSWAIIKEEIGKCAVRCANCHRRKTARQQKSKRWRFSMDRLKRGGAIV